MLYIHNSIEVHYVRKYPGCKHEAIDVIISKNNVPIQHYSFCKSPIASTIELIHYMDIIMQNTSQIPLAIIGDFNLDVTHDSNK